MSAPISAMIVSAARLPTPVMVAEPIPGHGERGDHLVDAVVEAGDGALQVLQVLQRQPDQQPVMVAEAPGERLAQLGQLLAELAFGQRRQHHRVAFPGDQGGQYGPAGDPEHVGGDRVEFAAGVLQRLVHPLGLGGVGLDQLLAVAG
jgi:hypothetical protein